MLLPAFFLAGAFRADFLAIFRAGFRAAGLRAAFLTGFFAAAFFFAGFFRATAFFAGFRATAFFAAGFRAAGFFAAGVADAAGLGAGLTFEYERAHLVVDIGGGTTNIAIVASGGIVSSVSLTAAGNAMDESIRDYVRSNYCLQIGEYTAEALKRELGALDDEQIPDDERTVQLVGKQLSDGAPCAVQITAEEVREAIKDWLKKNGETIGEGGARCFR